jgi:uncharacterized protein (TIGR03000 family)
VIESHLVGVGRLALAVTLAAGVGRPARAAPPDARPPSAGFHPYFGSPGAAGPPASFTYPSPGVYSGRVFNPFGTPGIPLTATAGPTLRFPKPVLELTRFEVRLPAEARLWANGQPTRQTGAVREFVTPTPLAVGRTFRYTFRAQWEEGGRTIARERVVEFQAGGRVTVDFAGRPEP